MKAETKRKLLEAWQYCDDEDKSTEFMLEYMHDFAGVDLDCVMNFIEKTTDKDRQNYIRAVANDRQLIDIITNKKNFKTMEILTNDKLITLGRSLFKVEERKINSCTGCDGGDHCKEVYARFHDGTKMGCHRLIFKLIEKK